MVKKQTLIAMIERAREAWEAGDLVEVGRALDYSQAVRVRPRRPHPNTKYEWATLEVGGTFTIDAVPYKSATAQAANASRRYGRQFKCKKWGIATIVERVA